MDILAGGVCLLMHCKCEQTDSELSGPDGNEKKDHYSCYVFKGHHPLKQAARFLQTLGIIQIWANQVSYCLGLLCIINTATLLLCTQMKQNRRPFQSSPDFTLLFQTKQNQNTFSCAMGVCDQKQTPCIKRAATAKPLFGPLKRKPIVKC